MLLAAAFAGAYLDLDPERLCREAIRRFERRFRAMESEAATPVAERSLEELMAGWNRAKSSESNARGTGSA